MRHSVVVSTSLAIAFGALVFGVPGTARAQMYGYGMIGPGMMGPGYGQGMMMYGPAYNMRGPGGPRNQANLNLSADEAKHYFERWIAVQGNSRLKVGDVKEKHADTIIVDIITKDNSLVERLDVNRHDGSFQAEEG
jgi:hypothetical protein